MDRITTKEELFTALDELVQAIDNPEVFTDEMSVQIFWERGRAHWEEPVCQNCNQLVEEKQDLRDVLSGLRDANRQAYRQIALFMEDGLREHLIVAQAILDPDAAEEDPVV